ncbi:alpha/beta hydrolase [Streptomyces sp. NBC_00091]|uniref:alpha/beta hydrolase n=1 Tax=Streptomyces sp. NBC_00091 TaxID=2975648 RepID=UPI002254AA6A|nr:alpha/beta hydrolase [Streptomyces sp. NBC_00091]MCX5375165.1 alpha/beta hydrolase [Streptomyces sp. NBC_00091]
MRPALSLCAAVLFATAFGAAGSPPPQPDDPRLSRFYEQRIDWGPCPAAFDESMRCGRLTVPLDYTDPGKGTVGLALTRFPATGPHRLGSLVFNYGGPGGPGVSALGERLQDLGRTERYRDLAESYDLVGFDPRGVGQSAPISCGGALPVRRPDSADAAGLLRATEAAQRACRARSGPVLPYVGTVNVARDLDVLRQALGDRKLNYLGWSYGTRIGATYAAQFPQRTGRMVLDGVDTLSDPLADQALATARGQQLAYDAFLDWCAGLKGCVFSGTNRLRANERTAELVAQLDEKPLGAKGGGEFDGQDLVLAIENNLYSPRQWPDLARGLGSLVRERDPSGLVDSAAPDEDNTSAAWAAVSCADYPDRGVGGDPVAFQRQIDALRPRFLAASKVFGPGELTEIAFCQGWPAPTDPTAAIHHADAPPMLLVGVRGDPATPYEWTEQTARVLGNAVVIDYKGSGHTGFTHSDCVNQYVERFLLEGRLPHTTAACPAEAVDAEGHESVRPAER